MIAELPQYVTSELSRSRWEVFVTDRNDTRHNRDDLSQILVQGWGGCRASHTGENCLNSADNCFSLGFEIRLNKIFQLQSTALNRRPYLDLSPSVLWPICLCRVVTNDTGGYILGVKNGWGGVRLLRTGIL